MRTQTRSKKFSEKRSSAFSWVEGDIEGFPKRTQTYINNSAEKIEILKTQLENNPQKLAEEIKKLQSDTIGAMSNLINGAIKGILNAKYFLPRDRKSLISEITQKWHELVDSTNKNVLFDTKIPYVFNYEQKDLLSDIIDHEFLKIEYNFYLSNHPVLLDEINKIASGEQKKIKPHIKEAIECRLKYVKTQTYIDDPSEADTPFDSEHIATLLLALSKIDHEHKQLLWFEKNGSINPYPSWWISNSTYSEHWKRVIKLEFDGDCESFFLSDHDLLHQIIRHVNSYENKHFLDILDDASFIMIGKFINTYFFNYINSAKKGEQNIGFALEGRKETYNFAKKFCVAWSNHLDIDEPELQSSITNHITALNEDGTFIWSEAYFNGGIPIQHSWERQYQLCGYESINDFMKSQCPLVLRNLSVDRYNKALSDSILSEDAEIANSAKYDLIYIAQAAYLQLQKEDYPNKEPLIEIIKLHTDSHENILMIDYLEKHDSCGNFDSIPEVWANHLPKYKNINRLYLSDEIDDAIDVNTYESYSYNSKVSIAEAAITRLSHTLKNQIDFSNVCYTATQIDCYLQIAKLFVSTQFYKDFTNGINIKNLKNQAKALLNQTYTDITTKFDTLTFEIADALMRQYDFSWEKLAIDERWSTFLLRDNFEKHCLDSRIYLAKIALTRLMSKEVKYSKQQRIVLMDLAFAGLRAYRNCSDAPPCFVEDFDDSATEYLLTLDHNASPAIKHRRDSHRESKMLFYVSSSFKTRIQQYHGFTRLFLECPITTLDESIIQKHVTILYLASIDENLCTLSSEPIDINPIIGVLTKEFGPEKVNLWLVQAKIQSLTMALEQCKQEGSLKSFFEKPDVYQTILELIPMRKHFETDYLNALLSTFSFYVIHKSDKSKGKQTSIHEFLAILLLFDSYCSSPDTLTSTFSNFININGYSDCFEHPFSQNFDAYVSNLIGKFLQITVENMNTIFQDDIGTIENLGLIETIKSFKQASLDQQSEFKQKILQTLGLHNVISEMKDAQKVQKPLGEICHRLKILGVFKKRTTKQDSKLGPKTAGSPVGILWSEGISQKH